MNRLGCNVVGTMLAVAVVAGAAGCGGIAARGKNAEGVRLFEQGRFHDALRQFQEASYEDPDNADAYYNLAATLHRLGWLEKRPTDLKQAEEYYNRCLDKNPHHHDCYRALAVLLAEQGRNEEAFRLIQGWVDRHPSSAEAKIELARLYEEFGERQAAKQQLLAALAIEPDNVRANAALGRIRELMGEHSQALAAYQRAWARDNRQPELAARIAALQGTPAAGNINRSW
jgi:Tfp pilus assembly protein PilF